MAICKKQKRGKYEMKIAIASDHGGFELKEEIKKYLEAKAECGDLGADAKIDDLGTYSTDSVDYPIYGEKCARAVAAGKYDRGIVVCGTGIGISIAANKVKGIRCGLCTSVEMARLTRQHNNANMLALGGRTTKLADALDITETFLTTDFEGGRHERRVKMLDEIKSC